VGLQHDASNRYSRENDLSIIGGKSCKKFLQNHVGAESWTFALEVCCFFAHVGLKVTSCWRLP
jgi:hypothetical protein